jgi:hypothetical protein
MITQWEIKHKSKKVLHEPIYLPTKYRDTKDPCPVFDGKMWHIFGSGGDVGNESWQILHITAPQITGPWKEEESLHLPKVIGKSVAAPGVIYDEGKFHMFVQTDCFHLDGKIEYLISDDGANFEYVNTALYSLQQTQQRQENMVSNEISRQLEKLHETGVYDSHPAIINDQKYIVYSGMSEVGRPDIYLAKSTTNKWDGPWERVRPGGDRLAILTHEEVIYQNQLTDQNYEWGLEGAQLLQLPNKLILLIGVCFLPVGVYGTRQRIFFALAEDVNGPYKTFGIVLNPPASGWASGENGHAAAIIYENKLELFYQARAGMKDPWRYGIASFNLEKLQEFLEHWYFVQSTPLEMFALD